jgi:SAM-dependent methyltransferase
MKYPGATDPLEHSSQVYQGAKARGYEFAEAECDANVYDWARRTVRGLAAGRTAVDIGCGKGQLLAAMDRARLLVGIDASADMVRHIPDAPGRAKVNWPVAPQQLEALLAQQREVIVCGQIEDVLPALGMQMDVALSAFNIVCFADAAVPLAIMHRCLKPGGRLVAISNVWVPRELAPDGADPRMARAIDLHAAVRNWPADLPTGLRFQLVLHLRTPRGEPHALALVDHVHTLVTYARALPQADWEVEGLLLYPPEGCAAVDPAVPSAYSHLYSGAAGTGIHSPKHDPRFAFAKACLVAVKR